MIIGVTTGIFFKKVSGSKAGIDFRSMIEDLTKGEIQFRKGGQKDDFSRGDHRNRGSSVNFSQDDRRQRVRLNVLKVSNVQSDQTLSAHRAAVAQWLRYPTMAGMS
ncbi:hypothetical protein TNCV_3477821 [Trichonephila clavipes]|nr:hypothetical protein TNCV_3477821 [Trichonephila clavipes]